MGEELYGGMAACCTRVSEGEKGSELADTGGD